MQAQSITSSKPQSSMDNDGIDLHAKKAKSTELIAKETNLIPEISHLQKGVEKSLTEQFTQKVNDQKQEASKPIDANDNSLGNLDAEMHLEIEREVERAIEERKNCIRNECIKSKKRLDLGSCRIDDLDALTISIYLNEQHTNLELLHLGANLITDEGLINLLSGLQWHTNLKELYLGNNYFTVVGVSALIDTLPVFRNLEILSLGNIGITDESAVLLSYVLLDLLKLRTLNLSSNKISDTGLISFGILIASNQLKCSTLHLGENNFTTTGLVPFFKSFQNDSIKALSKGLIKNTCLQELNIGNCGIDDESVDLMRNFLMFNNTLKGLHLWGNRITNQGALLLLKILENNNQTLITLTISDNFIEDNDMLEDIKSYLKQNESFLELHTKQKTSKKNEEQSTKNTSPKGSEENSSGADEKTDAEKLDKENVQSPDAKEKQENHDEEQEESDEEGEEKELQKLEEEINKIEEEQVQDGSKKTAEKSAKSDKTQTWKGFENSKGSNLLHSKF